MRTRKAKKYLGNERGVAMLMALTSITILAVLAAELIYETEIYHKIVYNNVDELRTELLARAGLKLARLQVLGSQKATQALQQFGKGVPVTQADVDQIWQTPMILPPPMPPKASMLLKESVKKLTDELELSGTIMVNITGESGKLNLNRLVWKIAAQQGNQQQNGQNGQNGQPNQPNQGNQQGQQNQQQQGGAVDSSAEAKAQMRKSMIATLDQMLKQKKDTDEEFRLKYDIITGENLVGNILAWIDPKQELDGENGPKQGYYRDLQPSIGIKNAPLFTMSELHMVKDFDDTLVDFISNYFTVMITDGINVNAVDEFVIRALFPKITDDNIKKLEEKRKLTNFNKIDEFWTFMKELGFGDDDKKTLENDGINLTISETAFRVSIDAKSGDAHKVWLAHLGSPPPRLTMQQPNTQQAGQQGAQQGNQQGNQQGGQQNNAGATQNDNSAPVVIYLKTD